METRKDLLNQIGKLLSTFRPEDIYRSVYDHQGNLMVKGAMPVEERLIKDFKKVDFKGKTIVDLGCNLGLFSFIAADRGAAHVTGIDQFQEIIDGCYLFARLRELTNVSFKTFDMELDKKELGTFDMAVLIDFFGKSNIRKQKIPNFLNLLETLADKQILTSYRPVNRIKKDLKMTVDEFGRLYDDTYIKDGCFLLFDYINDLMSERWTVKTISNEDQKYSKYKKLFLYERKPQSDPMA